MAHFAKLNENNIVEEVIVVNDKVLENKPFPESEEIGIAFCKFLYGQDTNWKQTSYNNNFRKKYAGIGYKYIEENDCFLEPKVYNSWILNENCDWEAPIPYPEDGILYDWNEETLSWDVVEIL
jgi:hypothetical protein